MNWLAHLYLSEPDAECRLGNLFADYIKGKWRDNLSPQVRRGVACHRAIDAFTDFHPLVQRSKRRIADDYGHFAGILVDVFYDHYLARDWRSWSEVPLGEFTAEVYESLPPLAGQLPDEARAALGRMIAEDRLGSYREIDGIKAALRRLSVRIEERLGRAVALERGIGELRREYATLEDDFAEFFPLLCGHVRAWQASP